MGSICAYATEVDSMSPEFSLFTDNAKLFLKGFKDVSLKKRVVREYLIPAYRSRLPVELSPSVEQHAHLKCGHLSDLFGLPSYQLAA